MWNMLTFWEARLRDTWLAPARHVKSRTLKAAHERTLADARFVEPCSEAILQSAVELALAHFRWRVEENVAGGGWSMVQFPMPPSRHFASLHAA